MKKKVQTTSWLDTIIYIIIPIIMILGGIRLIRGIVHFSFTIPYIISFLLEILFLFYYGYIAYYVHKRDKRSYFLLLSLVWLSAIQTSLDVANTRTINDGNNFFLVFAIYLGICYIVWIYPNQIYFKKRQNLFQKTNPTLTEIFREKKETLFKKKESEKIEKKEDRKK